MSGNDGVAPIDSELLRQRIRLYLYGELGTSERLEIERCRDEDPAFRALFRDEQEFLQSLGDPEPRPEPDDLLAECRARLDRAIALEPRPDRSSSALARGLRALRLAGVALTARPLAWQPAAAALLLLAGFLGGRGLESEVGGALTGAAPLVRGTAISSAGDPALTGIEAVRLDPLSGQVQIVIEERRTVSGDSSDPFIRGMLLTTVQESHTGARLTSLDALRDQASDSEIREALLRTMLEDEDVGVRLKALEAVQAQARLPDVRRALVQTLERDPSPGMRAHAIEILRDHADRDMAGPLQELIEREPNAYVVQESERILDAIGASMERY